VTGEEGADVHLVTCGAVPSSFLQPTGAASFEEEKREWKSGGGAWSQGADPEHDSLEPRGSSKDESGNFPSTPWRGPKGKPRRLLQPTSRHEILQSGILNSGGGKVGVVRDDLAAKAPIGRGLFTRGRA